MERPSLIPVIIGSGFGSGFWPWGPGTAGAILATALWYGLSFLFPSWQLPAVTFLLVLFFTITGTWSVARLQPFWGEDPKRVVVDEMVGVWIPLLLTPSGDTWLMLASLVLFRFFDILKPLGIRRIDKQHGAFYVMADDILAGIYSLTVIALLRWVV